MSIASSNHCIHSACDVLGKRKVCSNPSLVLSAQVAIHLLLPVSLWLVRIVSKSCVAAFSDDILLVSEGLFSLVAIVFLEIPILSRSSYVQTQIPQRKLGNCHTNTHKFFRSLGRWSFFGLKCILVVTDCWSYWVSYWHILTYWERRRF